jgi:hypothetical protein
MKKPIASLFFSVVIAIFLSSGVDASGKPKPLGFSVGSASYTDVVKNLDERRWAHVEYEKKQFKRIKSNDPARGKNTFIQAEPKDLEGIRNIKLFFSSDSTLDALSILLEPAFFEVVMLELDQKYELVRKSLIGEDPSTEYPHVLWQEGSTYINLQRPSRHRVRLLYVEKGIYENYKDFFHKVWAPYRLKQVKKDWMKDL